MLEPARRDRRPEHERHHAGAEADQDAPQRHELPELSHGERSEHAGRDHADRGDDDEPDAEAVDQGRGERRNQAEKRKADGEGRGNVGSAPAELLFERSDQDARRAHRAGVRQHDEERRARHDPAVKNSAPAERRREAVREREGGWPGGRARGVAVVRDDDRLRHEGLRSAAVGSQGAVKGFGRGGEASRRARRRSQPRRGAGRPPTMAGRGAAVSRPASVSATAVSRWSSAVGSVTSPIRSSTRTLRPTVDRSSSASRASSVNETVPALSIRRMRLNCATPIPAGASASS